MTKIQPSLVQRLAAMTPDRRHELVRVIVTVSPGANISALESRGLKVERAIQSVSVVTGTVSAGDVEGLAALDDIRAIEHDGEIRAL